MTDVRDQLVTKAYPRQRSSSSWAKPRGLWNGVNQVGNVCGSGGGSKHKRDGSPACISVFGGNTSTASSTMGSLASASPTDSLNTGTEVEVAVVPILEGSVYSHRTHAFATISLLEAASSAADPMTARPSKRHLEQLLYL